MSAERKLDAIDRKLGLLINLVTIFIEFSFYDAPSRIKEPLEQRLRMLKGQYPPRFIGGYDKE